MAENARSLARFRKALKLGRRQIFAILRMTREY